MKSEFKPQPGTMWLVIVECIPQVIQVAVDGSGFFIPGQEPCWHFPHVQEWVRQVWPVNKQSDNLNIKFAAQDLKEVLDMVEQDKTTDREKVIAGFLSGVHYHNMADRDALLQMVEIIDNENARLEAENRKLRDQLQNSPRAEVGV